MSTRAVSEFYYTQHLPARAVAIAQISTAAATPADLTDVNNTPYQVGSLGVWKAGTSLSGAPDVVAPDYGVAVTISGATTYSVANPYFELTNKLSVNGLPLFYRHSFSAGVADVKILDLQDNPVVADVRLEDNTLYHSLDGSAYRVRYVEGTRVFTRLLRYDPVWTPAVYAPSAYSYLFESRTFEVSATTALRIRFVKPNGYRVAAPYTSLPNMPWFARVGTSLTAPAPEWARQLFSPERPYMLGTWVPGIPLSTSVVEFERKNMLDDSTRLPDILVFDKDYRLKYALEGSAVATVRRRGSVYHWKRGQILGIDPTYARVELAVPVASDDIIFGFYAYRESDVLYTGVDLNPFTNPAVKNKVVQFYYKHDGVSPFHTIYHQILQGDGTPVVGQTNDAAPNTGTNIEFARLVVGASIGVPQVTLTDVRVRGGGLAPQHQSVPEAVNFWDIGYWDGKPYPIGAAMAVYLPASVLDTCSREEAEGRVNAVLPLGVRAVVRYYQPNGEELV